MTPNQVSSEDSVPNPGPRRPFLLRDPEDAPRRARRRRYALTLLGLLLVGASVTMVAQLLTAQWTTQRSYTQWMMHDLERLIEAQNAYHVTRGTYAREGELGASFVPSQSVHVTIIAADETGWHAQAAHLRSDSRCVVTFGTGASTLRNLPSASPACNVP